MSESILSCREAARRLWALLDDALPDGERAAVVSHLGGCAECDSHRRHAVAFRRAVRDAGRRLAPPPRLLHDVRTALRREGRP